MAGTGTLARKELAENRTSYATASHWELFSSHTSPALKHWGS